ncbi:hypothetical protein [Gordonia sp. (in: high G+C Gram-positive bacteria)]|uniref:hypothetical protein n=1 Tax=Gordonia sp. (in: high G+C Gram-positive bacteria) TaxID=84139 RepID=UPI00333E5F0F
MSIDPTTCKPDEAYVVTLRSGATSIAIRLVGLNRRTPWAIPNGGNFVWLGDDAVTVLHRLVPEQPERQQWETVRCIANESTTGRERTVLMNLADRLEDEHRAAQEKAEQDARRREIASEAIDAYKAAVREECGNIAGAIPFESGILAVVDTVRAAVLAEAVES